MAFVHRRLPTLGIKLDRFELSGAFADVGVLVPIAVALIVTNGLSATAVLLPAGLLYGVVAVVYRVPVAVQPLKAFGAIAIAEGFCADEIAAGALLMGAIFPQFDLGTASYDLLNSDYVIGLANTVRRGWFSTRLRLYHQSSHLGDEYLLREPPDRQDREDLSFEALEWLLSADAGPLRLYGGGEMLFRRVPEDLGRYVVHGGAELRPLPRILPLGSLGGFRFVAAADVKSSEEQDWDPAISARAGLEYDRSPGADANARRWGIFAEFYTGPSPYGQFFREQVRLVGLGIHFGGF